MWRDILSKKFIQPSLKRQIADTYITYNKTGCFINRERLVDYLYNQDQKTIIHKGKGLIRQIGVSPPPHTNPSKHV
jgi:hypothetical protein